MRVLFVCTGNICRSPSAEGVLRHHAAGTNIETDSAGIQGYHIGDPPDPRTIKIARSRGYDLSPLRARQVRPADFNDFDLILAMDQSHRNALVEMAPPASSARIEMFLDYAPHYGLVDVPDPYYGEAEDFENVLDLIEQGIQGLIKDIA